MTTATFRLGTERQHDYAEKLVREGPYETVLDAAADILERDPDVLLATAPNAAEASRVLTVLEKVQPGLEKVGPATRAVSTPPPASSQDVSTGQDTVTPGRAEPARPSPTARNEPRFLTARHLRNIALGKRAPPSSLDEDAEWVLRHLKFSLAVEAMYVPTPIEPINGNAAITIDHLVSVFGSLEQIAEAFSVSLGTVKGWGTLLPQRYASTAEIQSGGRVRAPR